MSEHLCGAACIVIRLSDVNTCCKHHNRICPTSITYSPDFCVPDNINAGDIQPVSKDDLDKRKKKKKKKCDCDDNSVKERGKSKDTKKTASDKSKKRKAKDSTKPDKFEEPKKKGKEPKKGVKSVEKIENPKKKTTSKKENEPEEKVDKKLKKNNNPVQPSANKLKKEKPTDAPIKKDKKKPVEKTEITKKSSSHTNKESHSLKEKVSEKIKTPVTKEKPEIKKEHKKPVTSHESGDETHKSARKKPTSPKIEEKEPKKEGKRGSKKVPKIEAGKGHNKETAIEEDPAERRRSRSEKGLSRGKYIPNKHCKTDEIIEESTSVQNMNLHKSRKRRPCPNECHPCNVFTKADRCLSRQASFSIAAGCKNSFVIKTQVSPCPSPCPCPCPCSGSGSEYVNDKDNYSEDDDDGDDTIRHKKRGASGKNYKRVDDKHEKADEISNSNKSHTLKNRKKLPPADSTDSDEHDSKSSAARKKTKKKENSSDDDSISPDESDDCSPNDTYDDATCKGSSTKFIFKIVRDESTANPSGINQRTEGSELNELEQPRIQPPQIVHFDVENYDQLGLIVKLKPEPSSSSEESLNNNSGRCLYIVLEVDKKKPQDSASSDSDCSPQFSIQESNSSKESLVRSRTHSRESNKSGTQSQSHESCNSSKRDGRKYRNHMSSDCDCEDNIDECNDQNRRKKKTKSIAKCINNDCHCRHSSDSEGEQEHNHVRMRHTKFSKSHGLSSEKTRCHSNDGRSGNCNNTQIQSKNIKCPCRPDICQGGRNSHCRDSLARSNEKKRLSHNHRASCQDKNQKDVDAFECCVHDFLKRCHKD